METYLSGYPPYVTTSEKLNKYLNKINIFFQDFENMEESNKSLLENNSSYIQLESTDSNSIEKKKTFEVIYPDKEPLLEDEIFLPKKRSIIKRKRRENYDNIRVKIKRAFINKYLHKKLNEIIKSNGSKLYFQKFPIYFVSDIKKERNKKIINMTLLKIIENQELYKLNELNNYYHNLKVVNDKEIQENEVLKKILNKTYSELYEEYINSKEFKIDEINRLKDKNMEKSYIERYIYLSKHFIDFYSN